MTFIATAREGVILSIRLTPGASANRIEGPDARAGAKPALKVKVRAKPEEGAANLALIEVLAEHLGLRKSALEVISGHASRQKRVLVRGDAGALLKAISGKLQGAAP